ncbi:MAG: hypothetical protein ACJ8EF_08870, partial [Bradyrhizobium sp.]
KLREIIPQPLDGCLAHAPGTDGVVGRQNRPVVILEAAALRSSYRKNTSNQQLRHRLTRPNGPPDNIKEIAKLTYPSALRAA